MHLQGSKVLIYKEQGYKFDYFFNTDTMVGFERPTYTVSEDAGSLEVCIDVQSPNMGSITISAVDGTALG